VADSAPSLHPDLAPVADLIGTWSGRGHGEYPTIEPFDYAESITFGHVGKPFLSYVQRTRSIGSGAGPAEPMHAESGYWRFPTPGRVEIVLCHPTGVVEIEEGTIELRLDGVIVIDVASTHVYGSSTAKEVAALARTFHVGDDTIDYRVSMAAVGRPLQHHLAASLVRDQSD